MWVLDYKDSWAPKNWWFWTVVLDKTLESPLDCKKIQTVHPKGNQSWIFIGRTDAEAETPILWPPDVKNWLIWKDTDAGKDWRRDEKGTTEDEMVGWHHRLEWVWVNFGSWWWTGRPGVLQSMGLQIVRHNRVTELNWTELNGPNIPGSYAILLFTASDFASITSHIHNGCCFFFGSVSSFFLELFIHWSHSILGTYRPGEFIFQWPIFLAFSYCSWGSYGKNTEMVCHSLLQWTMFCQNPPPWPVCLGRPYMAWLIVSVS